MGSRIREDVKHLFECFCEVARPQTDKGAWIIQKYPETYRDEEVLKTVPNFAFPCDFESSTVQHFSFVLTSIDSKWTFGFCRHDSRSETALVVLSFLPWHETFYKFLNTVAELMGAPNDSELWSFLEALYAQSVPDPGGVLQVTYNRGQSNFTSQCPNQHQLPSIPDNRNLTEYYSAVDANNMMIIFASMLYERRIIFTSKKLSRLSACVQAANAILYPMNWQHIFIPVLPMSLIDYLLAPMPFLIGVPHSVLLRVQAPDLGDVVILDADNNTVKTPFQDLESLPTEVVSSLKRQLRNRAALLGDGVSRAFLRALVQLIGGYRDALRIQHGEKITFNSEAFIESRPSNIQPFLKKMLQLQIFQQFIEERLDLLNSGLGFSDEFELEACNYSEKSSSRLKQQYREWSSTMKKEGAAFFKSVKSKANPAMKSAVKSVRERGKEVKERSRSAYKGIRSRIRDMQANQPHHSGDSSSSSSFSRNGSLPSKPRSAPASPTSVSIRHTIANSQLPVTAMKSYRRPATDQRGRSLSGAVCSPPSSPESSTPDKSTLQMSPINLDLMGDLQDVIFRKCLLLGEEDDATSIPSEKPPVDRSLKPVRSFDLKLQNGAMNEWSVSAHKSPPVPFPRTHQSQTHHEQRSVAPVPVAPARTPTTIVNNPFTQSAAPFMVVGDDPSSTFVVACPSSSNASSSEISRIPPPRSRRHKAEQPQLNLKQSHPASGDLIRLDSTPGDDEFDPLKCSSRTTTSTASYSAELLSQTNPIYPLYSPPMVNTPQSQLAAEKRQELALLHEYGLASATGSWLHGPSSNPFLSSANTSTANTTAPQSKTQWATFD